MTTTVTKTIGSSGCDYTTIASWFSACPSDLTAVDQIWKGVLKNEEFTSTGRLLNATGKTTDATRYVWLTTDTGCSFRDNGSVQSNALRYNASNGAAIRCTGSYSYPGATIYTDIAKLVLTGLQIANDDPTGYPLDASSGMVLSDFCIIENRAGAGYSPVRLWANSILTNSLIIQRAASGAGVVELGTSSLYNCTLVTPSDVSGRPPAIYGNSGSPGIAKNCALFGSAVHAGTSPTYTTCYTDVGSPPSGVTQTTFSNAFENVTDSARDFRLKSGSALIDSGTTDSTNAAIDIAGTSRPSGSAYDVGCWEYVSGGGGGGSPKRNLLLRVG